MIATDTTGRRIVTGGITDGTVKLWDAATGRPITTLRSGTTSIRAVWFTPDDSRIGYLDETGTIDFLETDLEVLLTQARSLVPEGRELTEPECLAFFGTEDCG
jgi:WD40 repeat protein